MKTVKFGVLFFLLYLVFFHGKAFSRKIRKNTRGHKFFYHTIKSGDTLYSIAKKYHTSVTLLKKLNGVSANNKIYIGKKLRIAKNKYTQHKKQTRKRDKEPKCCYKWPVDGVLIANYGINKGIRQNGIKIKAKTGEAIRAICGGVVVFAGVGPKCTGNMIILAHDGFFSVYAHNATNRVRKWQKINAGDVIGSVGSTGCTKEVGLYFEIRKGKKSLNPLDFLRR